MLSYTKKVRTILFEEQKLTKQKLKEILEDRFKNDKILKLGDLQDPFEFKDLEKGALRVAKAIKNQEKIAVVGDYDVDGVVASAIIKNFFDFLDYKIEIIIPNRFTDGYGVSKKIIEKIDANLVITVDNGISALDAANVAKQKKY